MTISDMLHNRQPQTRATSFSRPAAINAIKALGQTRQRVIGNRCGFVEQPELEVVQASDGAVAVGETALVSEGGGLGGDVGSSSEHEGQAGNKQGTMDGLHKQVWG